MTTRRWYYLIPAHGQPRGLVHAIERHNLDQLPGEQDGVCRTAAARRRADAVCCRACAAWRWNTRRCAPFRICRVSMPARPRPCGRAASRSFRREISSNSSRPPGRPSSWPRIGPRRQSLYRIKDRAFAIGGGRGARAAGALSEYELQQQMVRWFEEEGLVSDSAARRRGRRQRRRPALSANG